MMDIIGIDLGTTNSCAAVMEDSGKVKLIPYKGGEYTVPSIFAIDDKGNELVGNEAKRQWALNPKRTVYGAKRLIGREYSSHFVTKMHEYFTYDMVEGTEHNVLVAFGDRKLDLTEISSKILNKIRDVAQDYLQHPVSRAVVTVPAYFDDRQRQAVKQAGALVDLDVVRVINEPTAAAIAYGVGRNVNQKVAVYDLGGGTFDISVIEIRNRVYEVKATGGDVFLGGIDFDNAIIDHVVEEFQNKHGIDLKEDAIATQRIKDLAERTKCDLSSRAEAQFNIPFVTMTADGQPLDIDMVIPRSTVEQLTMHLIERTIEITGFVLKDAGIKPSDLDEVLLVGGMTRWPAVQKAVSVYFGRAPSKHVHPDEAVAIGAATFAWSLESDAVDQRITLLDVIPMAIGIEDADGKLHHIFERNAPVPNQKKVLFTTSYDDQAELAMRIYQGEQEQAKVNTLLGEFLFSGIRQGQSGEVRVDVVFDLSQEGILTMSAEDRDTHAQMTTSVKVVSSESNGEPPITVADT
ncbi:MAG: Hsp70 family protein [Deltaproteobacteria bacterium]|nr:Hsp70 family protein [Deltaproteobacteria bacterium]